MAETSARDLIDGLDMPVCEYCGCRIDQPDQQCPALDQGVCAP